MCLEFLSSYLLLLLFSSFLEVFQLLNLDMASVKSLSVIFDISLDIISGLSGVSLICLRAFHFYDYDLLLSTFSVCYVVLSTSPYLIRKNSFFICLENFSFCSVFFVLNSVVFVFLLYSNVIFPKTNSALVFIFL